MEIKHRLTILENAVRSIDLNNKDEFLAVISSLNQIIEFYKNDIDTAEGEQTDAFATENDLVSDDLVLSKSVDNDVGEKGVLLKENMHSAASAEEEISDSTLENADLKSINDNKEAFDENAIILENLTETIEEDSDMDLNDKIPILSNLGSIPDSNSKEIHIKVKSYQAKNGQVGVAYQLSLTDLSIDDIVIHQIIDLEGKGLQYSKENSEITGIPNQAGEFEFEIEYNLDDLVELKDANNPELLRNRILKILINPDPRSLWKVLDPPSDSLYQKPHFQFVQKVFLDYKIYGASIRGRSHAHAATHRDDDFAIDMINENILFAAVADGAGSAKYSREGSRIICNSCQESLINNVEKINEIEFLLNGDEKNDNELSRLAYNVIGDAVKKSYDDLSNQAKVNSHDFKDYSSTLILTLVVKTKSGYCIISYGMGDGVAALITSDRPILLTEPDSGSHAGQTRFITMNDTLATVSQRIRISFTEDLSNLFLVTDGISDVFFETDAQLDQVSYWNKMISQINQNVDFSGGKIEDEFKEWINFFSRGNHDDRTIIWIR